MSAEAVKYTRGFYITPRGIDKANPYYFAEVFTKFQAWNDLNLMATHQDYRQLKRGQIKISERRLADRWKWSKTRVHDFIQRIQDDGQALVMKSRKGTIIHLIHYANEQNPESYRLNPKTHPTTKKTTPKPIQNINKNNSFQKQENKKRPPRPTTYTKKDFKTNKAVKRYTPPYIETSNPIEKPAKNILNFSFKTFSKEEVEKALVAQATKRGKIINCPKDVALEMWQSPRGGAGGFFRNLKKAAEAWLDHLQPGRMTDLQTDLERRASLKYTIDRLIASELLPPYQDDFEYQFRVMEAQKKHYISISKTYISDAEIERLKKCSL
jgi:hypothetical protein